MDHISLIAQFVQIGAKMSTIIKILFGVFHGSILGPILFIIFMNDVVVVVGENNTCFIYADDTSLIVKLSGNRENDQKTIDDLMVRVGDFMDSNSLAFNGDKSEMVVVSVKKRYRV